MKRRSKKAMLIIIGILICLVGVSLIFFNIPYSKCKAIFDSSKMNLTTQADTPEEVFIEEDISELPEPVQRYFRYCGYIGKPKMSYIKIYYEDVDFISGKNKPMMKIDYTQYNFAYKPDRIAYIDSSMYGIPFEGLDTFIDGSGSMKGVIAKVFTLFDQKGKVMDQSSLVTYLAEILFIPTAALQDYVKWEPIDDLHVKATMSYSDLSVDGIFTFNEAGEMLSFETDDRNAVETDGVSQKVKWSVVCDAYTELNGTKKPTIFQAIWHYENGDQIYFDGTGAITSYN